MCSYGEEPAGIHADTQEPEQPCHLTERDLLVYCRCLWLSVHLLSPAKTGHTVGYPELQTVTRMRSSHPAKPLKHFFPNLFRTCAFSSALILITVLSPTSCSIHIYPSTPSLSFSPFLLIPPHNIHLANAPSSKHQHPLGALLLPLLIPPETTSPRLLPSYSAWLVPMYS